MKIGMILDKVFPPDPRVEQEAKALIAQGHKVFLFCAHSSRSFTSEIHGIHVVYYQESKWLYKLSALAYSLPFYHWLMGRKISQFVKRFKPDILHVHDIQVGEAVRKVSARMKLPFVLDLHENRPAIMPYYQHIKSGWGRFLIFPKVWRIFEVKLVRAAKAVVVVTEEAKEELISRVPETANKIIVVPNTVSQSFYQKKTHLQPFVSKIEETFAMLYIGDTGERRGLATAIQALAKLKLKIPSLRLVVLGRSKEDVKHQKMIQNLGLENEVFWEGWQDPGTFQSYIYASKVCLSPLHKNTHHNTTYANKLFQYLSLGKPVLVSDATAQKNLVKKINAGLVHKEKDVSDFCAQLTQFYNNERLRSDMGLNGKRFVMNHFYFEKTVTPLLDFYTNFVK